MLLDSWVYYSCHSTVIIVGIAALVSLMTTFAEGRIVGTCNLSVYRLTVDYVCYISRITIVLLVKVPRRLLAASKIVRRIVTDERSLVIVV